MSEVDQQPTSVATDLSIPAPWRLDDPINSHVLEDNDGYHVIEGDSETEHLRLTGFMPLDVARLIAAAPDLLAALRKLVECKDIKDRLDGWEAGSTQEMAAMDEWYTTNKPNAWEAARKAVAKAEGKL